MERLGEYRLGEELGSDEYSVVYEAREGARRFAVRVLKDEAVPEETARRNGLARALASLNRIEHPSAVRVVDGGEEDGNLFVVSELMDCPTLEQKLQDQQKLEEQQVVLFVRQAAQALDKVRDVGLYHGDLKPANVFVVSEEKIKVGDFAVRGLVEDPPEAEELPEAPPEGGELEETDWVSAEDLLRSKGRTPGREKLEEDFVGLATLMMGMFGADVPDRPEGQELEGYREDLIGGPLAELSGPDSEVSTHSTEVIRRLLTPGGFDSPGEVVVELASAMLLRRSMRRPAAAEATPGAETVRVAATEEAEAEPAAAAAPAPATATGSLAFQGDPRGAVYTPFFVWKDRHVGQFFVIYDGESLVVGRDPDVADVVLMDPALSRKHCIITKSGGEIRVEDCGSTNGTFVNEQKVESAEVGPEDNVRVGATRLYMTLAAQRG